MHECIIALIQQTVRVDFLLKDVSCFPGPFSFLPPMVMGLRVYKLCSSSAPADARAHCAYHVVDGGVGKLGDDVPG
jgi:hypothetical protein